MKYIAQITISSTITADSKEEALDKARSWQEEMAGSNDGSEMIANVDIEVTEVWVDKA